MPRPNPSKRTPGDTTVTQPPPRTGADGTGLALGAPPVPSPTAPPWAPVSRRERAAPTATNDRAETRRERETHDPHPTGREPGALTSGTFEAMLSPSPRGHGGAAPTGGDRAIGGALRVHDGYDARRRPATDAGLREEVTQRRKAAPRGPTAVARRCEVGSSASPASDVQRHRHETVVRRVRSRQWDELHQAIEGVVRRDYPTLTRLITPRALGQVVGRAVADCLFAGHRLSDRVLIRSLRDAIERGLAEAVDLDAPMTGTE